MHRDTDKEKVDGHLAALVESFRETKIEARHLREQVDAKQAEIDDLQRQVRESRRARKDLEH